MPAEVSLQLIGTLNPLDNVIVHVLEPVPEAGGLRLNVDSGTGPPREPSRSVRPGPAHVNLESTQAHLFLSLGEGDKATAFPQRTLTVAGLPLWLAPAPGIGASGARGLVIYQGQLFEGQRTRRPSFQTAETRATPGR